MGFSTDFVGHIDIEPPLNDRDRLSLRVQLSRRYDRADPYEVPGNPARGSSRWRSRTTAGAGQPNLWCDWAVCWDGCCITWSGKEKSYYDDAVAAVRHRPLPEGGCPSGLRTPAIRGLHLRPCPLGAVVGCRRDNKELFAIRVKGNVVSREVMVRADPRYVDYPPLPYEDEIDRQDDDRRRRRRRPLPGESSKVVPLARRSV